MDLPATAHNAEALKPFERVAARGNAAQWIKVLCAIGRADSTVEAYGRGLEFFLRFCEEQSVDPEAAGLDTISLYVQHLREADYSNSTLQQRLTALRQWYDYLYHSGRRDKESPIPRGSYKPLSVGPETFNAHRGQSRGLVPRTKSFPWIPTDEEWAHFLKMSRDCSERNRLMIALSYDGALRRQELVGLDIEDFDFAHRILTIRPETSKSAREPRHVTYSEATSHLLHAWLQVRRSMSIQPGPLLISQSNRNFGERISKGTWNDVLTPIAEKAGLRSRLTTHTFRHLRLTHLARKGLELHEIATYAGHRSVTSTMTYIHMSGRELGSRVASNLLDVETRLSELI